MLVTIDSTGYSGHCLIYGAVHDYEVNFHIERTPAHPIGQFRLRRSSARQEWDSREILGFSESGATVTLTVADESIIPFPGKEWDCPEVLWFDQPGATVTLTVADESIIPFPGRNL
jgi:hypothetical protein